MQSNETIYYEIFSHENGRDLYVCVKIKGINNNDKVSLTNTNNSFTLL